MITVLGKLADTQKYLGKTGYNVLAKCADWSPSVNERWLRQAVARGDQFLLVSIDCSGQYRKELELLLNLLIGQRR
jgi:hypothetical protein